MLEDTPYASIEAIRGSTQGLDASGVRGVLLEAKLIWGGDTIAIRHLRPSEKVTIRDVGSDVPGAPELVVAREAAGVFVLCLPNGATVPAGCRMTLRMGRALLRLTIVADDVDALPAVRPDTRVALGIIAAAALHLVVLGLVAHGRGPQGAQEQAALETMQRMVAAAEERALVEVASAKERSANEMATVPVAKAEARPAALAGAPAKERGRAGNPSRSSAGSARITRGDDPRGARPSHEEVTTFGILSLLAGPDAGDGAGSSAFASEVGPAAMGNIFGQAIHDAEGMGGLGLSGAGEGGGGQGAGVPLAAIGTLGRANGDGTGQGFGRCESCSLSREHAPSTWVMRGGGGTQVNGRLPPEAIQRIVRQSFGRIRACYAKGLQRSPDLEGRIAVKFVIDREGDVAMASTAESSIEDAAVNTCVAKAYEAMTFPKPEGGIVTVVYPVVFSRTSP